MLAKLTISVLLSCLLLTGCSKQIKTSIDNKDSTTLCKNLHKVVDIDDLLKQMYDNIDSDCLFKMPTNELETIWGIKIFDNPSTQNFAIDFITTEYNFTFAKYTSPEVTKDNLYIAKHTSQGTNAFYVFGGYARGEFGIGSSFEKGKYPYHLPPPLIYPFENHEIAEIPAVISIYNNKDYKPMHYYFWLNSNKDISKNVLLIKSYYDYQYSISYIQNMNQNSYLYQLLSKIS